MNNNNIDDFIKSNLKTETESWNKEDAWNRLNIKRRNNFRRNILTFSIISIVIISLPFIFIDNNTLPNNNLTEYQKRKKLQEIEDNLSGFNEQIYLCDNCKGKIIEKEKNQNF